MALQHKDDTDFAVFAPPFPPRRRPVLRLVAPCAEAPERARHLRRAFRLLAWLALSGWLVTMGRELLLFWTAR
jgi:hypothetical protein